jgi:hypothetical protein
MNNAFTIKPIDKPRDEKEKYFNQLHSHMRGHTELTNGMIKNKFR